MFILIGRQYGADEAPSLENLDPDDARGWERLPESPLFRSVREAMEWFIAQPSEDNYYPYVRAVKCREDQMSDSDRIEEIRYVPGLPDWPITVRATVFKPSGDVFRAFVAMQAALDRVTQERDNWEETANTIALAKVTALERRAEAAEQRVDDLLDSRKRDTETIDSLIEQRRILDERVKELTEALNEAADAWPRPNRYDAILAGGSPEGSGG